MKQNSTRRKTNKHDDTTDGKFSMMKVITIIMMVIGF